MHKVEHTIMVHILVDDIRLVIAVAILVDLIR